MTNKLHYDIFISYSRHDKESVEPVAKSLSNSGIKVWLDSWDLIPGQAWKESLEKAIQNSSAIAVFIGPSGFGSRQHAEIKEYIETGKQIIPILLPGASTKSLPSDLLTYQWVDLRDKSMQKSELNRLFVALGRSTTKENKIEQEQQIADDLLVTGDLTGAQERYEKALKLAQLQNDESTIAQVYMQLGNVSRNLGDYETALTYLKQSLAIRQQIGDKAGEGTTLNNMATTAHAQGDYATALTYLNRSLAIQQQIGDKAGEGATLNNLSQIFMAQGDYATALTYLNQSLDIRRQIGDKAGLCATLFNMGHIHAQNNQMQEAFNAWVTVYVLAKQMNLAQALKALADLAPQLGLPEGLEGWETLSKRMNVGE